MSLPDGPDPARARCLRSNGGPNGGTMGLEQFWALARLIGRFLHWLFIGDLP